MPKAIAAEGNNISGLTDAARLFLAEVADFVSYFAYFQTDSGIPLFRLKGTTKCVGAALEDPAGGVLLFVPDFDGSRLKDASGDVDEAEVDRASRVYVDAVLELAASVRVKEAIDFPSWADAIVFPEEARLQGQLREVEGQVAVMLETRDRTQSSLAVSRRRKLLFTGTGQPLVDEVQRAFEAFGCLAEPPEPGRDDLIIHCGERTGVVEVKGVGKSAAESHAAQLEKWVSSHLERSGKPAKGILVVNAFKDTPIGQRTMPAFPDQMLEYSTRRQHALVTGLQLLAALIHVERGTLTAESVVERLFQTDGRVENLEIGDALELPVQPERSQAARRRLIPKTKQ
jgi:hypothetical protein